jgi:hypothetical protein
LGKSCRRNLDLRQKSISVFAPVPGDLLAVGGQPGVVAGGLYLNDPLGRDGAGQGFPGGLLELVRGEEAAVRQTSPPVFEVDDAPDFGLEGLSDFVEQIGKGGLIGSLRNGRPGGTDVVEFPDIGFEGIHPRPLCHERGDLVNTFLKRISW